MQRKGPRAMAIPMDVRNVPMVVPRLPAGARSWVMARAVGAKAARVRAWKMRMG